MLRCLKTSKVGRPGRLGEANRLYCELKRHEDGEEVVRRLERDLAALEDPEANLGKVSGRIGGATSIDSHRIFTFIQVDVVVVVSNFSENHQINFKHKIICRIQTSL